MYFNEWNGFKGGKYQDRIDVRDFIINNFTVYLGDKSFLASPTPRTKCVLEKVDKLLQTERDKCGVLDIDTENVSSLLTFPAGYIDKEKDIIVGLQTNSPLKRSVNPFGGIRMARSACEAYGYKLSDKVEDEFKFKTTHNDGVFRVYTPEMRKVRSYGLLTGLPDAYGRGRIIGDYRRVALYGVDLLIEEKNKDKNSFNDKIMTAENIQLIEELYKQIDFLKKLKEMAKMYNRDISLPAKNTLEAVQWTYFAYLGAIKEQNGAAMSLGRVSTFFDIYVERDLKNGVLTEDGAQEIFDDFVLKLRVARHLRTPEYNELFGGDPMWITECVGGIAKDGRPLVTKSSFRILNTLNTLSPAPEPNLTVLWSNRLPAGFKEFATELSIETDSLQYENDDLMRDIYGDDYGVACCVSAMKIGKQMQFFGARCNLPKLLLLALNGGKDDATGEQIAPLGKVFTDTLNYNEVLDTFKVYRKWIAKLYVNTMNIIHFMHDKYAYEKLQMALHDTNVERVMAFGVAGLSVLTDSLSAIKNAKVTPILNEKGLICDFKTEGDFPKFGNDIDNVDFIAKEMVSEFIGDLRENPTYRNARHTLSVLTITSNVVYGKKTSATPDGRKKGEPYAPGANPMHHREFNGALASLNSVAKLPYMDCQDGISNTFSIVPEALGETLSVRKENLIDILDGYFNQHAHHLNVNVISRAKLVDCMNHPEKYPNLTIRVSGYAVNFNKLSLAQQKEVLERTYHDRM